MTSLRNLITPEEYQILDNYRITHLPADSHSKFTSSYDLLKEWESAKSNLFCLLGDQLTYSFPVHTKSLDTKIDDLLKNHPFVKDFNNWLDRSIYPLSQLLKREHLVENNLKDLITPTYSILKPDGHKITFDRKSHPLRILQKISNAFGFNQHFEDFRNECSKATQFQSTYTCTLSIHPMDFLTLSNNANGWKSCLNLDDLDPGCYSAGISNILNSPYLLVAYIASSDRTYCGWNSKIWRETFIVTPGLIMGIKGYPNWDRSIESQVLQQLRILAMETFPLEPTQYDGESKRFSSNPDDMFCFFFDNAYDDLCYEHACYLNYTNFISKNIFDNEYNDFEIAGTPQCLWCGELYPEFDGTSSPVCIECDFRPQCVNCGERHSVEEVEGVTLCVDCIQSATQFDGYNEEYVLPQNTSLVCFDKNTWTWVRTTDIPDLWLSPVEPVESGYRRGINEEGTFVYMELQYNIDINNLSEEGKDLYDYIRR